MKLTEEIIQLVDPIYKRESFFSRAKVCKSWIL